MPPLPTLGRMDLTSPALAGAAVALVAACVSTPAHAAPPPYVPWVTLQVDRCEEVTFRAPPGDPGYVPHASFRTAVVTGRVLAAGVHPSLGEAPEPSTRAAAGLPAPGDSFEVAVVASRMMPATCEALKGTTRKFVLTTACDTLPRAGACVVSKPLAFSFASA